MRYIDKGVTFLQGPLYSHHDLLHTRYMGLRLPVSKDILTPAIRTTAQDKHCTTLTETNGSLCIERKALGYADPSPSNFLGMCSDPSKHTPRYSDGATDQLRGQNYYYLKVAQGVQGFWEDYML